MKLLIRRIFVCTALLLVVISCTAAGPLHKESDFTAMTSEQRRSFILNQPIELQVDTYIEMLRAIRPPDLSLENALASGGEKIIPYLKRTLQSNESDIVK